MKNGLCRCPNLTCKSDPVILQSHERLMGGVDTFAVGCAVCDMRGPEHIYESDAVQLWNALPRFQTRPEVASFALGMEVKLQKHDEKRGNSWRTARIDRLRECMLNEIREMDRAIHELDYENVADECTDIANFAMFIATVALTQKKLDEWAKQEASK